MQRTGWGSMFGKNNESSSSSERTRKLKTKHIFRNRDTLTDTGTLFYDSKKKIIGKFPQLLKSSVT